LEGGYEVTRGTMIASKVALGGREGGAGRRVGYIMGRRL
jgi:hypothetical protein